MCGSDWSGSRLRCGPPVSSVSDTRRAAESAAMRERWFVGRRGWAFILRCAGLRGCCAGAGECRATRWRRGASWWCVDRDGYGCCPLRRAVLGGCASAGRGGLAVRVLVAVVCRGVAVAVVAGAAVVVVAGCADSADGRGSLAAGRVSASPAAAARPSVSPVAAGVSASARAAGGLPGVYLGIMAGPWYGPEVRPRALDLGADWSVGRIRWADWTGRHADGRGYYGECAGAGGPCQYYWAGIRVWQVREHHGMRYFARMRITGGRGRVVRLVMTVGPSGMWVLAG
jgi:hypothetical protein